MKNNIKMFVLILIEIVIICVGVRRALKDPIDITINQKDFINISDTRLRVDNEGLHTLGIESGSIELGDKFTIHSGAAYEIYADYEVDKESLGEDICSIYLDLKDNEFNELHQTDVALYNEGDRSYSRIYAEGSGEAQAVFKYRKGEIISLKSIRIVEKPIWQYFKLISIILLFGIADFAFVKKFGRLVLDFQSLGIILLVFFCAIPCIADFQYGGHDLLYHMQRIANIAKELSDGQFPVRLYSYVYEGYGYGAPLFYCDIFLYIPALLYNMMVPLYACDQIYIFGISVVTVFTSYYCFKYISNDVKISLIGSFLYVFSPYRIACIWVRAAFGEYTALAFLPLILWGMYAICVEKEYRFKNSLILGAGVSFTTLCHILSVELSLVPLVLTVLILWKRMDKNRIKGILVSISVFAGMTLWFLVPMFDSIARVGIKAFNSSIEKEIQNSGVFLIQLLNPFFSYKGANIDYGMCEEMPLSLGIGAIAGLILPIFWIIERKQKEKKVNGKLAVVLLLGAIVAYMTTIHFPWNFISRMGGNSIAKWLNECQFTWRYMGIASLLLIAALCILFTEINIEHNYASSALMIFICTISIVATASFFSNYVNFQNEYRTYAYWDYSKGYLLTFFSVDANTDGTGDVKADIELENREAYIDNSGEEGKSVSIPVYAYLNVKVRDKSTGSVMSTFMDENGLLRVMIPQNYKGTIQVYYREPIIWRFSEIISVLVLIGLLKVLMDDTNAVNTKQSKMKGIVGKLFAKAKASKED